MLIYSCAFIPFELCFTNDIDPDFKLIVNDVTVEVLFWLDIFLNFFTPHLICGLISILK